MFAMIWSFPGWLDSEGQDRRECDNQRRGVKVTCVEGDQIDIDLFVTIIYGASLTAVAENAIGNVRYRVEDMTGLKVRNVNIHVEGVRA